MMNGTGLAGFFLGLTGKSMIKLGQLSFIILSFLLRSKKGLGEFSEKSDLILVDLGLKK